MRGLENNLGGVWYYSYSLYFWFIDMNEFVTEEDWFPRFHPVIMKKAVEKAEDEEMKEFYRVKDLIDELTK